MADIPTLVEDAYMGDWLRQGPMAVEEALIAHRTDNPCKLVRKMLREGTHRAVIFKSLVKACREYKAARGKTK